MAKTESTAVNALIDLAVRKPLDFDDDSAAEMFRAPAAATASQPPRPQRAASGTQGNMPAVRVVAAPKRLTTIPPIGGVATLPPPLPTRRSATLPPPRPTGQRAAEGTPTPELFSRSGATLPPPLSRTKTPTQLPVAAPFEAPMAPVVAVAPPRVARQQPVAKVDQSNSDGWFQSTREAGKVDVDVDLSSDDEISGTMAVHRQGLGSALRRIALPAGLLFAGAIAIGMYFALATKTSTPAPSTLTATATATATATTAPAPAPAAVAAVVPAAPAPAPETAVAAPPVAAAVAAPVAPVAAAPAVAAPEPIVPAPAPAQAPHMVNVRFDSQPSGATVMLVDGGKTSFLGTSPVDVAVDSARTYDVVFTLDGHPTQVQHLDAAASPHVTAMLTTGVAPVVAPAQPQVAVATPAPAAPAPALAPVHHHHVAPTPTEPVAPAITKAAPAAASSAGKGVLMISSKPPCDIVIDGRPTGLTTPQRAISLSAGPHKVTLINTQQNLTKASTVTIRADQSTKLIQNLLK